MMSERDARMELMLYLAYKMEVTRSPECREIIKRHVPNVAKQGALLQQMVDASELVVVGSGAVATYALDIDLALDILWEMTEQDMVRLKPFVDKYKQSEYRYHWGNEPKALRDLLLEWKFRGVIIKDYDWRDIDNNNLLKFIIREIIFHPNWSKIIIDLDPRERDIFAEEGQWFALQILDCDTIELYKRYAIDAVNDATKMSNLMLNSTYTLFSHILTGRIAEVKNLPNTTTSHFYASQAISHQYANENGKAIIAWRKAIKESSGSKA